MCGAVVPLHQVTLLHRVLGKGNAVVGVERSREGFKTADGVIDLGPGGGKGGGLLVAGGTPEAVARTADSHTGQYLARVLAAHVLEPAMAE